MSTRSAGVVYASCAFVLTMAAARSASADYNTWVSGVGDDVNPCTRTAPCRTFAGALPKTDTFGTIGVLDPGEFGGVLITKSVTIDGGGMGKVRADNGVGITIQGGSYDVVTVRNLTITIGPGLSGGVGIDVVGGRRAQIEHCSLWGLNYGIRFKPLGAMDLTVIDTTIQNGGAAIWAGTNGAFFARLNATNVRLDGNTWGVTVRDNARVYVKDSIASNSVFNGFDVQSVNGGAAHLDLENTSSSNNHNAGIVSQNPGAVVRISNTTVDHNGGAGVVPLAGGLILSFGNNHVSANAGGDGSVTGLAYPM